MKQQIDANVAKESTPTANAVTSGISDSVARWGSSTTSVVPSRESRTEPATSSLDRLGNRKQEPCQKGGEFNAFRRNCWGFLGDDDDRDDDEDQRDHANPEPEPLPPFLLDGNRLGFLERRYGRASVLSSFRHVVLQCGHSRR
jgi:hypothetical protein